jgi:hypothetical protein
MTTISNGDRKISSVIFGGEEDSSSSVTSTVAAPKSPSKSRSKSKSECVLLEGWMLKLNRNSNWQDRYFIFQSDQTLSYWHKPKHSKEKDDNNNNDNDDDAATTTTKSNKQPTATFNISLHAGCEIGDLYVEQRNTSTSLSVSGLPSSSAVSSGKESLYCINITWTEDAETVVSHSYRGETSDDVSYQGGGGGGGGGGGLIIGSPKNLKNRRRDEYSYTNLNQNNSSDAFDVSSVTSNGSTGRKKLSFLRRRKLRRGSSTSDVNNMAMNENKMFEVYTNDGGGQYQQQQHQLHPHELALSPLKLGKSTSGGRQKKPLNELQIMTEDGNENDPFLSMPLSKSGDDDSMGEQQQQQKQQLRRNSSGEVVLEQEQEKLHHQYMNKQKKRRSVKAKRVADTAKVAMAAGAAVGVGVLTAGVGIAAGLVFLGGAAAIGGTAGVAEAGFKRTLKKKDTLTIATTDYALARLWKSKLDACLEQESIKQSTWAQRFVAGGGITTSALIPRDVITLKTLSEDDDDATKANNNLFMRDSNFFAQDRTKWRPLEGGWVSFLGPGAQSLRIFKEEKILYGDDTEIRATTAIDDSTCTPLRSQLVLNAHPTEAFMCIMSYARIQHDHAKILSPNSGQTASYRLLEKIDDRMDVLHLVCRKLFLFPAWTEARDFVVTRYWRYEPDGSYIICFESTEHPDCPPQPGFVRGTMHQVYTIAPPKSNFDRRKGPHMDECMLTAVVQVDPKGWIPTRKISCLSNQTYADAFGVSALLQTLDIQDAIENDRFRNVSPDLQYFPQPSSVEEKSGGNILTRNCGTEKVFDMRYVNRERCESHTIEKFSYIGNHPKPLAPKRWAEPDPNSFIVRGPKYKDDGVKINAGASIGHLIAVDVVRVDKPMLTGMSVHPTERIQLALQREKEMKAKGQHSDAAPPFTFVVNIVIPGMQCFHAVFYFAVDDMSTIDGSDDTPSSRLCQKFIFGESDEFRDETFKLIPRIVEGNFIVRKAVGSTPAIMGTRLKQYYVRTDRFMELILDCGSSQVAEGVLKLSLGYAKTLVVDMGFLLEAVEGEHLPERIFGCVRVKYPSFGNDIRKVEEPSL